jgi:hypothetical protein
MRAAAALAARAPVPRAAPRACGAPSTRPQGPSEDRSSPHQRPSWGLPFSSLEAIGVLQPHPKSTRVPPKPQGPRGARPARAKAPDPRRKEVVFIVLPETASPPARPALAV